MSRRLNTSSWTQAARGTARTSWDVDKDDISYSQECRAEQRHATLVVSWMHQARQVPVAYFSDRALRPPSAPFEQRDAGGWHYWWWWHDIIVVGGVHCFDGLFGIIPRWGEILP